MRWVFEGIIFFYLAAVGACLVQIARGWKQTRRRALVGVVAGLLAVSWLVIFWGSFVEPRWLIVRETPITLSTASDATVRVAVISDLHLGPYLQSSWAETVVARILAEKPDLILLAGDFISSDPAEAQMLFPLSELSAPLGVFAVTGNHDYESGGQAVVIAALKEAGIRVLQNERVTLDVSGSPVVLAGVSDIWNDGDAYRALVGVVPEETVILLAHNPDVVLSPNVDLADLVIAGHTHGGQIRLPLWGPVPQIPDELGNQYDRGLFSYGSSQLFITSGTGETGPRARLFNPPEIAVLTVHL